ncbi:hypothetical protein [Caballeronia sp. INML1]|uniref:hypothetical protein n=1 Tax=Caballeronia sp. INML1 TaxID=2921760 RepID=UPI002027A47A|nr:hypothetical protein [Caballeronia sp. INML1]
MARSEKPAVIERIFNELWDEHAQKLTRSVVTSEDVIRAIAHFKEKNESKLSVKNPANFIKDVIRSKGASRMWPESLKERRITAKQVTGDGNVFEFVQYQENQTEPFPERFGYHEGVWKHQIQSISMPQASKALGRDDETYLIQVAVKLAVVETHFALQSPIDVVELTHLQVGIKLRRCEVDSLFSAIYKDIHGTHHEMIITAEAKNKSQRILEEQIMEQVRAAFKATKVNLVVPIAMTAAAKGIYLAEFKGVKRSELDQFTALDLEREALYELCPAVKGI